MSLPPKPRTINELKSLQYQPKSIKQELKQNLETAIAEGKTVFEGILGYENTVLPEVERAILAGHNINFLGLRGQAKTRIARQMTNLLDEWIPIVEGSEINDDPLNPISAFAKNLIEEKGEQTPIVWLHRSSRYVEKLATPDVSVADLIGDLDPIKAANLRINYNDERAIHFGLIPRSHRCIFVINELPDLQAKIQVALFNMLQENDLQIRGFTLRLPLDVQFVFTSNPEDYTNRGSIVTPLKDRIGSQILTHYPKTIDTAIAITEQETIKARQQFLGVELSPLLQLLIENIAFQARKSEFVDQKSGVSARLSISAAEAVMAGAYHRKIINKQKHVHVRPADLQCAVQAINGKIEMVYEGELEGAANVANTLIIQSIKSVFETYFPVEEKKRKNDKKPLDTYREISRYFHDGNFISLHENDSDIEIHKKLEKIPGLKEIAEKYLGDKSLCNQTVAMEFILHGMAAISKISKTLTDNSVDFKDLFEDIFSKGKAAADEEGYGYYEE